MELGIYSFGDLSPDPITKKSISAHQRMKNLMEEVIACDQMGLDVFAIGEHHRKDFIISSPAVVLAAAASVTKNIRLSSAVTVLSSDDPVRVYQQFASLDLLSDGRAELMAGRGSFIESFPLFGYRLEDYDELFTEKLDLLIKIIKNPSLSWTGIHRPALRSQSVYPRALQNPLPLWIAAGGTPESAVRAAKLGLPLALAIIGGMPQQFVPFVRLYRDAAKEAGTDSKPLRLSINSHGYIAENAQDAAADYYPGYADVFSRIGAERGWGPVNRAQFDALCAPKGALLVGSPQQVIDKILYEHELFQHDRFLLQIGVGSLPHSKMMKALELYGTQVAPAVRKALAK